MGNAQVEQFFRRHELPYKVIYLEESSATVELAARALGLESERIAKSLALRLKDRDIVLVVCGTARIDNRKFKDTFACKAKMLSPEETLETTGHPVGGVCPFGLPDGIEVYLDESLRRFDTVYPAAGSGNSAVEISPMELAEIIPAKWVDVAQTPEE